MVHVITNDVHDVFTFVDGSDINDIGGLVIPGLTHSHFLQMDVSKNRGKTPKVDGENNEKPLWTNGMIWG